MHTVEGQCLETGSLVRLDSELDESRQGTELRRFADNEPHDGKDPSRRIPGGLFQIGIPIGIAQDLVGFQDLLGGHRHAPLDQGTHKARPKDHEHARQEAQQGLVKDFGHPFRVFPKARKDDSKQCC